MFKAAQVLSRCCVIVFQAAATGYEDPNAQYAGYEAYDARSVNNLADSILYT